MLIDADWHADCWWLIVIDADRCWLILIDSDWCWLFLISADWCWYMLIDAVWFCLMLFDAQTRFNCVFFCRSVPPELLRSFFSKSYWPRREREMRIQFLRLKQIKHFFSRLCEIMTLVNDWWKSLKLIFRYFWKIFHLPLLMLISFSGIFSSRSLLSLGDNLQRKRKKEAWWREYINLAEPFKKRSSKSEVKFVFFFFEGWHSKVNLVTHEIYVKGSMGF